MPTMKILIGVCVAVATLCSAALIVSSPKKTYLQRTRNINTSPEWIRIRTQRSVLDDKARRLAVTGNYKEAEKLFRQSLAMLPKGARGEAHYELADVVAAQGRYGEALTLYEQVRPGIYSTAAEFQYGSLLKKTGQSQKAAAVYRAAFDKTVNYRTPLLYPHTGKESEVLEMGELRSIAYPYSHTRAKNKATALEKFVKNHPDNTEAYRLLHVYVAKADAEEAKTIYKRRMLQR